MFEIKQAPLSVYACSYTQQAVKFKVPKFLDRKYDFQLHLDIRENLIFPIENMILLRLKIRAHQCSCRFAMHGTRIRILIWSDPDPGHNTLPNINYFGVCKSHKFK
jgi:hypothetical protein